MNNKHHAAFTAIVGRPNVGKSSVLNALLGTKVAIVSDKPQTTRTRIMGVLTEENTQLVFIDTPGLHKPKTALGEKMVKAVYDGMSDVDVCMLVVEAQSKIGEAEKHIINAIKTRKAKSVLVINKIDLVPDKTLLLEKITEYSGLHKFDAVIPVSCKLQNGLDSLKKILLGFAPESHYFFDEDTLTDQPERVIAAEIIREKELLLLDKEIPHGIAVSVESFKERETENGQILDIDAIIFCEKESHKGIIIGKNGSLLKRAATASRIDMERFFDCRVNLKCWVKVKEDWRNRQGIIHNFGLD